MPQLDFHNPMTLSQVVWMFLIFGALYLLMARWALPRVAEVVDQRAAQVTADLEAAREAKHASDAAIRELIESNRSAHAEAQAEITAAISHAKEAANAATRAAHERLDQQLSLAEARIAAERTQAMASLQQIAGEAAQSVVQRLTGLSVDQRILDQAVGNLLAARQA